MADDRKPRPDRSLRTLRLVDLAPEHLARILEIEKLVNSAPWSEQSFRNEIDYPHGRFRVALVEGEVVGYGAMWLVVDEAHITTVAVDPEWQRMGIGRRLMIDLLQDAKERGMECSSLEVRRGNAAAIRLYEELGYEQSAIRRRYYPDNQEDAVVMWLRDLRRWNPPT